MMTKPESTIILQKSRASNLIVLVDSDIKHEMFNKKLVFKHFLKKKSLGR